MLLHIFYQELRLNSDSYDKVLEIVVKLWLENAPSGRVYEVIQYDYLQYLWNESNRLSENFYNFNFLHFPAFNVPHCNPMMQIFKNVNKES